MQAAKLVFGPIPSRRLGRSLGINNIPPKTCPYACVYCQVGRTNHMSIQRQTFYDPTDIINAVEVQTSQAQQAGEPIDFLTFVPDGEPTLDLNLGQEIEQLKTLGHRVAVISNASRISDPGVRADLALADWVSLKVDAVQPDVWHQVDRPHGHLVLAQILDGIRTFRDAYEGDLVTETMLVRDINDSAESLQAVAEFLGTLKPDKAYISAPTRPPAEGWVETPKEETLHRAYQTFKHHLDTVELIVSYEGNKFSVLQDVAEDLVGITAVHPMREDAVFAFLEKGGADKEVAHTLVQQGLLARVQYGDQWFYLRRFSK